MSADSILETVGKIAGIGGLALGVFLLLFRDIIRKIVFPSFTKQQAYRFLRLIAVLVWTMAIAGLMAWTYTASLAAKRRASDLKIVLRELETIVPWISTIPEREPNGSWRGGYHATVSILYALLYSGLVAPTSVSSTIDYIARRCDGRCTGDHGTDALALKALFRSGL